MNVPINILSPPATAGISETGVDYLFRLQANSNSIISVGVAQTADVVAGIYHWAHPMAKGCKTLGLVIDRLKLREAYSNYYRDYLLGTLPADDFQKIAEQYAYTPACTNLIELSEQIAMLLECTTEEFTKNEVAELFRVTEDDVEKAVQLPLFARVDSNALR